MTDEDEPIVDEGPVDGDYSEENIVEFAIWYGDKLEGVVDKDKIENVLHTMKVNMDEYLEVEKIRIGCRFGNGSHTDKPVYLTFEEAYNLYGRS